MTRHRLEGRAIVSADDKIADAEGLRPAELTHPKDWARFQTALDQAALVAMGRRSHDVTPNPNGRPRLVLSRQTSGFERRKDAWWWNPGATPLAEALAASAPEGGVVAITGGREVFEFFLSVGFDAFHLVRLPTVLLPGGVPVFSGYDEGMSPEAALDEAGLSPGEIKLLDARVGLTVTVWQR